MKLWDNHMHCHFSGDSKANPVDMVNHAKQCGLAGITFTDHLDLDYLEEPGLFDLDLTSYEEQIHLLSEKEDTASFFVLCGLELGLQPHLAKEHKILLSQYAFDYVIGSTHVVHKRDPYYPAYFEGRSKQKAYREYYEAVYENLLAFHDFDALGHLDYVFRYGPKDTAHATPDSYTDYAEILDAILQFLIAHDIALEINTGAFRCGMTEPNPCKKILQRYHELGGTLITLGADAHKPDDIALGYEQLPAFLTACGFYEYMVYQKRIPHPHRLL